MDELNLNLFNQKSVHLKKNEWILYVSAVPIYENIFNNLMDIY